LFATPRSFRHTRRAGHRLPITALLFVNSTLAAKPVYGESILQPRGADATGVLRDAAPDVHPAHLDTAERAGRD
jgi:hypothetical protein